MKQDLEHLAHNLQPWRPWRILRLDNGWAPVLPCTQETSAAFAEGCASVVRNKICSLMQGKCVLFYFVFFLSQCEKISLEKVQQWACILIVGVRNIKLRNQHKNVLLLQILLESLAEESAKLLQSPRLNESVIDIPLLKKRVRQNMMKHVRKQQP